MSHATPLHLYRWTHLPAPLADCGPLSLSLPPSLPVPPPLPHSLGFLHTHPHLRALETLMTEVARVRLHGFSQRELNNAVKNMQVGWGQAPVGTHKARCAVPCYAVVLCCVVLTTSCCLVSFDCLLVATPRTLGNLADKLLAHTVPIAAAAAAAPPCTG